MTLHEMGRRLKGFDIRQEVVEVLSTASASDAAATLNQSQLAKGVLSTDKAITNSKTSSTSYSLWWGEYRDSLGLQIDHFDLKVTGQWWATIGIDKVTIKTFTIDAEASEKSANIYSLFGEKVLGMTDESKSVFIRDTFGPELRSRITRKLGFKFS